MKFKKTCSILLACAMLVLLLPISVNAFSVSELTALIGENGVITGNTTLPSSYNGNSITWSVEANDYVEILGQELVVKQISLDSATPINLKCKLNGQIVTVSIKLIADKQVLLPQTPSKNDCLYWQSFDGVSAVDYNTAQQTDVTNPNALGMVNEKLTYTRTTALPFDGMQLVFSSAVVADGSVIEFELTRPTARKTYIFPVVWGSNYYYIGPSGRLSWLELEGDKIYYLASDNGVNSRTEISDFKVSATNRFKTVYDFTNKKYDLYIDDTFIKTLPFNKNEVRISSFAVVTDANEVSGGGDVWSLDDVRIYPASGVIDVKAPPTSTVFDFSLDLQTSAGLPILWESDNAVIDVSSTPGIAKISSSDIDVNVNIKASVTLNDIKYFKVYNVLIPCDERPPMVGSKYLFYEDFNYGDNPPVVPAPDAETPTEIVLPSSNGIIAGNNCIVPGASTPNQSPTSVSVPVIEDGRLKLSWVDGPKEGRPNTDKAVIWFNADKSSFDPNSEYRLAVEYDIEAENANAVEMLINTGNGTSGLLHRFVSSNIQLGGYSFAAHDGYNYSGNLVDVLPIPKKVRMTFVFDNTGSYDKFDVYMNGIKIADDFTRRQYTTSIGMLCFGITSENTVYIDNIKVFNVGLSSREKVDADYISLTNEGFKAINSSLQDLVENDFRYDTPEGSNIMFSSDVPGLVNTDGTINRPRYSKNATVTATVYTGSYEKSVSYSCTIAGQIVTLPKDEKLSGWEPDGYYAIYKAYMLTDETVPAVVVLAAYDKTSGELIKTSVTDNSITTKTEQSDEDNIIYGFIEIPISKASDTRLEAFVLDSYDSSNISVDGELVIEPLDDEKSYWNDNNYTAAFPAFSLGTESDVYIVLAAYENGSMVKSSLKNVVVYPKGGNPDIGKDGYIIGSLNVPDRTENTVIKAMVWKDIAGMKPLVSVK